MSIPVLGQPQPPAGGVIPMLTATLQEIVPILQEIASNTAPPAQHIYALHPVDERSWLVYCLACSEKEARYVHPCEVDGGGGTIPPAGITLS